MCKELRGIEYFGRSEVMDMLDIKKTRASELINILLELNIIVPISGRGKGKYVIKED